MASSQFHLRFKDKFGIVTRSGEFSVETSEYEGSPMAAVARKGKSGESCSHLLQLPRVSPPKAQTFSHVAAEAISKSTPLLPKLRPPAAILPNIRERLPAQGSKALGKLELRSNSTLPFSQSKGHAASLSLGTGEVSRSFDFRPYSLADYKALKVPKQLGGLGPVMLGSEDWQAARKRRRKRLEYSQLAEERRKREEGR